MAETARTPRAGIREVTRKGPTRKVDESFGPGRLQMGRAFLKAAQDEAALAMKGSIGNPIISQIVNSAIGYADALTAAFGSEVNRQDHLSAPRVLRGVLGKRLPAKQARRLRQILEEKDAAQYGSRLKSLAEAAHLLNELEAFAAWAEAELKRIR